MVLEHTSKYMPTARVFYGGQSYNYITVTTIYCKYDMPTVNFIERLTKLLEDESRVLVGVDTNGHSRSWHSLDVNRRGRLFETVLDK